MLAKVNYDKGFGNVTQEERERLILQTCAPSENEEYQTAYSDETQAFFNTDLYQKLWMTVGQNVESDKSFPSGHTTAAFASMTALFLTGNKKYSWAAFIFAFLMAVARIYLVVHFASDVLAGVAVGVLGGILGTLLARLIPDQFYDSPRPFGKKRKAGGKHCSA